MSSYYVTIGLETHVEISNTKSKVFSSAINGFTDEPNVYVSPVDMGFPGILPTLNKECVRMSLMMASILHSRIPDYLYFERKNYYYPDLPKGYQITQNPPEDTVGNGGYLDIRRSDGTTFRVEIDNFHLEEDAAKLTHLYDHSTINYNRAGVPLLELVTTPSIHSVDDAITYLEYLRAIYQYCGISDADSRKGEVRCDVNVSISPDKDKLGTKVEVKNVNSFSNVRETINYEIQRQTELWDAGRESEIEQETRRFDEATGTTIHMRSKVDAIDYKYFVEPNIPRIKIDKEWVKKIQKSIPELPYERMDKYTKEYNLSEYDASIIIKDIKISNYFDECISLGIDPKMAANWINTQILGVVNDTNNDIEIDTINVTPKRLFEITDALKNSKISSKQAKEVFKFVLDENKDPNIIMKEHDIVQMNDDSELENLVKELLDNSSEQIADYKSGHTNLFGYFVGQIMKSTKGKANPVKLKEILTEELNKR